MHWQFSSSNEDATSFHWHLCIKMKMQLFSSTSLHQNEDNISLNQARTYHRIKATRLHRTKMHFSAETWFLQIKATSAALPKIFHSQRWSLGYPLDGGIFPNLGLLTPWLSIGSSLLITRFDAIMKPWQIGSRWASTSVSSYQSHMHLLSSWPCLNRHSWSDDAFWDRRASLKSFSSHFAAQCVKMSLCLMIIAFWRYDILHLFLPPSQMFCRRTS
jgi:hypothetical protein